MNTRFLLPLACAASLTVAVPAHARDDTGRNMIIGGIAGAIIGENNNHHAAEGAFIGATAGLLLSAITERNDYNRPREVYYNSAPCYTPRREVVVVARPYCPPAPRVVVIQPSPFRHHSPAVVVVRPPCRPAPLVVINSRNSHDYREDRREDRYYDRSDECRDRRDYEQARRDDRRGRYDNHSRDRDDNRYAYNR